MKVKVNFWQLLWSKVSILFFKSHFFCFCVLDEMLICKIFYLYPWLCTNTIYYINFFFRIVVALAKDLQKEFYVYYQDLLEILIDLLHTKDTEQLEWTFTCLAHLFKFLWRPLVKDIDVVFNSLLPLLSDSKPDYINTFAAESFAFVARKVKDKRAFLNLLLKSVESKQDVSFF